MVVQSLVAFTLKLISDFFVHSHICVQEEDDFGHLEDDLDGYTNNPISSNNNTSWSPFGSTAPVDNGAYIPIGSGTPAGGGARRSTHTHGGCCTNAVTLWKSFFSARALAFCYCCCASRTSNTHGADQKGHGGEGTAIANTNATHPAKKNLNMMSAFTHIMGDTLRTVAMFVAACVATITGIDGDLCDATAALVVTFTIVVLCTSLVLDILGAASDIWYEEYTVVGLSSVSGGLGKNGRKYASTSTYSRISNSDDEEGDIELR